MTPSFATSLDALGGWRAALGERAEALARFLDEHDLAHGEAAEQIAALRERLGNEKLVVAFVAEFSRGKSELINAIFFADTGRRILPATPGRTTMCPVELGWRGDEPASLLLLPIETRLEGLSLGEMRAQPRAWRRLALDIGDADKLAESLQEVTRTEWVTQDQARALGFWDDATPDDNPPRDDSGKVEVPAWRHALINYPHPLLKQGLVVLDTPGLNAIGAEPELTLSLLPSAHATVFILGADTGVTKSDLAIWREHLAAEQDNMDSRLVVLNKIDTMWDQLSSQEQIAAQIERQRVTSAEILGLPAEQVIPVSAQKALLAKVQKDNELLEKSNLPLLERALGHGVMGQRQKILRSAVAAGVGELRTEASRSINIRRRDLAEQMIELKGLRGKNTSVIKHMRQRIEQEQRDFDASGARIHAVRSVHGKLLRDVFTMLGTAALKTEMTELTDALRQPGFKVGVRKAYGATFERLRTTLQKAQATSGEIQSMLTGTFRQLNAEYGFSLQAPREPELARYERDLDLVERSHMQYLGVTNALRLAQPEFADRLVRALATRLRVVYESALGEVELWNKSAAAQLDAQLRERRRNFSRRLEAIERIQQAASGLDERITEIEQQEVAIDELDLKLAELTDHLVSTPEPVSQAADLEPVRKTA